MSRSLISLINEQPGAVNQKEMLDSFGLLPIEERISHSNRMYGANITPTDLQNAEIERLAQKLSSGSSTGFLKNFTKQGDAGEDEDDPADLEGSIDPSTFDLLSKPRVLVYEGKVTKRNASAFAIQKKSKRHLLLLNDLLLITSAKKSMLSKSEKYIVHAIIPLDEISIRSFWSTECNSSDHSRKSLYSVPVEQVQSDDSRTSGAFEILSNEKSFHFLADTEAEKSTWIETLTLATHAYCGDLLSTRDDLRFPGWQHMRNRSTIVSAVIRGEAQEVAYLLGVDDDCESQMDIDATDNAGMTLLHWAALSGNIRVVEQLVERGASLNSLNNSLSTPLHLAAGSGYGEIAVYLVEMGADTSCKNMADRDAGFNALLYAHKSPSLSVIVETLVTAGCDIGDVDCTGKAAIHHAAERSLMTSLLVLQAHACDPNAVVIQHDTTLSGPPSPTQSPRSPSAVGPTSYSPTALLLACTASPPDAEVIRALLDSGAFPNWKAFFNLNSTGLNGADLLIRNFTQRRAARAGTMGSSVDCSPGAEAAVEVSEFVQECLPCLMELAKKGCRFSNDSLSSLRQSVADAITGAKHYWMYHSVADNEFLAAVDLELVSSSDEGWTNDSASRACLCCGDVFSLTMRRHHCRLCGILCCSACSSKSLPSIGEKKGVRVCDACYNKNMHLFECRRQDMQRMSTAVSSKGVSGDTGSTAPRQESDDSGGASISQPSSPDEGKPKSSLFSWTHTAKAAQAQGGSSQAAAGSRAAGANSAAAEALQMMHARKQKLGELADKASELSEEASEFQNVATQLRKKMQAKNRWL